MLTMTENQSDNMKIKRFEGALFQARNEIQCLCVKIDDLEQEKVI